jgi:hypothetical protein
MSGRAVLTIVVSALICLALMGRPALPGGVDDRAARDAQSAPAVAGPATPGDAEDPAAALAHEEQPRISGLSTMSVTRGTPSTDAQAVAAPQPAPAPAAIAAAPRAGRPAILVPLYTSFITLQALDIHSTLRAPQFGGREANPVVGGMLGSPAALIATKAGVSAGIVLVSERLWRRNRAASIVTMAALNGLYTAIVARNYAIEARAR